MESPYMPQDIYDPAASRSPGAHRLPAQPIQRQSSRQFDAYGGLTPAFAQQNNYTPSGLGPMNYDQNRTDRMGSNMSNGFANVMPNGNYGVEGAQSWNPNAFAQSNGLPFAATTRPRPNNRGRAALPSNWMPPTDQPPMLAQNGYHTIRPSGLSNQALMSDNFHAPPEGEEELIPTAIVIKNIPFAVKKEQLLNLMHEMGLPIPYAFNYHFDNGVFRGLAFANYTSPQETGAVIEHLNHCEVMGRKLRVEYKKMLPLQERERIEREKRERRGQLEEQHRPINPGTLTHQPSVSSMNSYLRHTPSPQPQKPFFDLNDPQTLEFYNKILIFKNDNRQEALEFPSNLDADQRRLVHTIAHYLNLHHDSHGANDARRVRVAKSLTSTDFDMSSTMPSEYGGGVRGLMTNGNDMSQEELDQVYGQPSQMNPRPYDDRLYNNTLRGQHSIGLLTVGGPDSPLGFGRDNLRAAKSHADLRTVPSPSPSPSLSQSGHGPSRFGELFTQNLSQRQSSFHSPLAATPREDSLVNGFGSMTIGATNSNQSSPRRLRAMWSRESDNLGNNSGNAGAVGSNRGISTNIDDTVQRSRAQPPPARQPRGPTGLGNFSGFAPRPHQPRQNGHQQRSSDELKGSSPTDNGSN